MQPVRQSITQRPVKQLYQLQSRRSDERAFAAEAARTERLQASRAAADHALLQRLQASPEGKRQMRAQYHNEVSKRRQQLQHEARREAQVDRVAAVDADRADRSYAEYERARQRQSRELSRRCMEYNRTALHKKHATKPLPDPQVYAAQSDAFFGKFGTSLR